MTEHNTTIGNFLSGKNRERLPDFAFHAMSFTMKMMDVFGNFSNKNFSSLGIGEGQAVVDYGCGPARYVLNASKAVGPSGKVYAVDIHPLAIEKVNGKIKKYALKNVEAVLADGCGCAVPDKSADVIYALDMFHMIAEPDEMLKEFARMIRPGGKIIIEDGHQPRFETKSKILSGGLMDIVEENGRHVVCAVKQTTSHPL